MTPASSAPLAAVLDRDAARSALMMVGGLIVLALIAATSTALGVTEMDPLRALQALFAPILPDSWTHGVSPTDTAILLELRLPRTVMAMAAGAGLSIAGVASSSWPATPSSRPSSTGPSARSTAPGGRKPSGPAPVSAWSSPSCAARPGR